MHKGNFEFILVLLSVFIKDKSHKEIKIFFFHLLKKKQNHRHKIKYRDWESKHRGLMWSFSGMYYFTAFPSYFSLFVFGTHRFF